MSENYEGIPDDGVIIGTIEITYNLEEGHGITTYARFPDFDEVPLVTQLGMIELARDTLLRMANGEAAGDDE